MKCSTDRSMLAPRRCAGRVCGHGQATGDGELVVDSRTVREAFSGLVVNDRMLDKIGPAANSARSLFLYGHLATAKPRSPRHREYARARSSSRTDRDRWPNYKTL